MRLLLIAVPLMASCAFMNERDPDGSSRTFASLGGKGAYRAGVGLVYDNEASFNAAAAAGTAIGLGMVNAGTALEQENTTRNAANNITTQKAAEQQTTRLIDNNATKVKLTELTAP